MKRRFLLLWIVPLLFSIAVLAQDRGPSTPQERKRVVDLVAKLERDPLNPDLAKEREWAIKWLIEVPDVTVSVCNDVMGPAMKSRYRYNPELFALHTLAAAAFIIQHPDQAEDHIAVNVAATTSMLKGYEAIVSRDARRKNSGYEDLKATRDSDGLEKFVAAAITRCTGGPRS